MKIEIGAQNMSEFFSLLLLKTTNMTHFYIIFVSEKSVDICKDDFASYLSDAYE